MQTQTKTSNGAGQPRFISAEQLEQLKGIALEIEELGARKEAIGQQALDADELDAAKAAEYRQIDARMGELQAKATALGLLLTADQKLDEIVRPYVEIARAAAGPAAHELAGMIRILFAAALDVGDDLRPERERSIKDTAWSRGTKLKAYKAEGFTDAQAFALVLAEIKPPDYAALVQQMNAQTASAKTKKRRRSKSKR